MSGYLSVALWISRLQKRRRNMTKRVLVSTVWAIFSVLLVCQAFGQESYPNKPISLVVPWPAGAPGDLATRIVADKWSEVLGQPVIVQNKAGAAGAIGSRFVARSNPDGYTLLMANDTSFVSAPLLTKDAGYDLNSFRLLFNFSKMVMFVCVKGDSRWKTLNDLFAEAKNSPGKFQYSMMQLSGSDIAAQMLFKAAGVKFTPLPFSSSPELLTALAGGNADLSIAWGLGGLGKSGLIRPLATSDDSRLPDYPNVPTLKELGYGIKYTTLELGMSGPAGMPQNVVSRLVDTYDKVQVMYGNEIKEKLIKLEQYPSTIDGNAGMQRYREVEKVFREFFGNAVVK
jgi:tripartite-type tricarboxylate transporter receptor subunit TctC